MINKFLHWAPRILSIAYVAFLALFAADVFDEYQGVAVILALAMHLVIPFVVLLAAVAAWKWNLAGAVYFSSHLDMSRWSDCIAIGAGMPRYPGKPAVVTCIFVSSGLASERSGSA